MTGFPGLGPAGRGPAGASRRVAVLDWGIGGTATLALLAASPALAGSGTELLYLSDSGFPPYGTLSGDALARRLARIVAALRSSGVSRLAVACNAMSTALPALERRGGPGPGFRVFDIIRPGVAALLGLLRAGAATGGEGMTGRPALGVTGGARTIRSGYWTRPLRASGHELIARIAQPLSALIERGLQGSEEFREAAWKVCRPFMNADGSPRIGTLALACTHYPAAAGVFSSLLPGVSIFDPAPTLADSVLASLDLPVMASPLTGTASQGTVTMTGTVTIHAFTTGDPIASAEAAKAAFGISLDFRRLAADLP